MTRTVYDKSHFSFRLGKIGRVKPLTVIPVLAGESLELDLQGVFRLSPLRRNLTVDCMVDLFAFYRPYRHSWGDHWRDFIRQGVDESVTFPTYTLPADGPVGGYTVFPAPFRRGTVVPLPLAQDYWSIFNRFFRPPPERIDDEDVTTAILNTFYREAGLGDYGFRACFPKAPWNVTVPQPDAEDRRVSLQASQLDLLDLRRVKARYKTELDREYFGNTYNDLMDRVWDVSVNIDADQRPELIMRRQHWLSGYDTDGTAADNLGEYSGKSAAVLRFGFPRRYFPEHGSVWVLVLFRFPLLIHEMVNPILKRAQPDYKWLAGDPEVMMSEPPEAVDVSDWTTAQTNFSDPSGAGPYGMHHRFIPSVLDNKFEQLQGFPFIPDHIAFQNGAQAQIPPNVIAYFDNMFRSLSQEHWQCQSKINLISYSPVPSVLKSIYAGTR